MTTRNGPTLAEGKSTVGLFADGDLLPKKLAGSNVRPDSDIDILVEFEPEHTPGPAFFAIEEQLSELLGRKSCMKADCVRLQSR